MKHINILFFLLVWFLPEISYAEVVDCNGKSNCDIYLKDDSNIGEFHLFVNNKKIINSNFYTTVSDGYYIYRDSNRYYINNYVFLHSNIRNTYSFKLKDGYIYSPYYIYLGSDVNIIGNQVVEGAICTSNKKIKFDYSAQDNIKEWFVSKVCPENISYLSQERYVKSHDSKVLMDSSDEEVGKLEDRDRRLLKSYKFYINQYGNKVKKDKIGLVYFGNYDLDFSRAEENLACFSNCDIFESTTPAFTGFDKQGDRLSISYKIKNNSINGFYIKGDKKISVSGDYDSETHKVSFESSNGSINFNGEITDGTLSGNLKTDKGHEKLKLYMRILPN